MIAPKICPFPFGKMNQNGVGKFQPCCGSWLTSEFHQIPVGEDPWNGPAAQELRRKILEGNYRYCRREVCGVQLQDSAVRWSALNPIVPISEKNHEALLRGEVVLPEGPASMTISVDPRCNLACPSCRSQMITTLSDENHRAIKDVERLLQRYKETIEVLQIAGDGDPFFSPWMRDLIKGLDSKKYPQLKAISILTNGLLLNEKTWKELLPGSEYIAAISVSIDAGTSETYRRVRGGDWAKLIKNLNWISEQRQKKPLRHFSLNFTVRAENYRDLEEFLALGKNLNADRVLISELSNWERAKNLDYQKEAIHLASHPQHQDFLSVIAKIKNDPLVKWTISSPSP